MKYIRRCKGAVTIFLVIILVPMLTCSAFFVDVSRISLARGVAASAGDLALNTALTQYDTQLKELYGLFATTQDHEKLLDELKAFYNKSIISYGVGAGEAGALTAQIMAQLRDLPQGDSGADDILNMKLGDFKGYIPPDGSLANPDVLERQIVEFMKYRTPINTGLRFLSALNSFNNVSKETKLVDQRQSYFKEEERLNKKLRETWKNLSQYNDLVYQFIGRVANDGFFAGLESKFREFHVRTIMDVYETQIAAETPLLLTKRPYRLTDGKGNPVESETWELECWGEKYNSFVSLYPGGYDAGRRPSIIQMQLLMNDMRGVYSDKKIADIKTSLASLGLPKSSAIGKEFYDIQYVAQLYKGQLSPESLRQYIKNGPLDRYRKYQDFAVAMLWADDESLGFSVEVEGGGRTVPAAEFAASIKDYYEQDMRMTRDAFQPLAELTTNIRILGRTERSSLNKEIKEVTWKAKMYQEKFEDAVDYLQKAADALKDVYDSLNGGALIQKREEWRHSSEDPALSLSSLAEQDKADIKDIKDTYDKDQVAELYNRVESLRKRMAQVLEQINQFRYAGEFVGDITGYDEGGNKFLSLIRRELGDEYFHNRSKLEKPLREGAESSFDGLFEAPVIDFSWMSDPKTGLSLFGSYQPVFYQYLYRKHSDPKELNETKRHCTFRTDKDEEGEKLKESMKKTGENETKKEKEKAVTEREDPEKTGESLSETSLPSKTKGVPSSATASGEYSNDSDNVAKSTSTGLAGMFSGVAEILSGSSEDLRDAYYVTDYLLSMFSFDTIQNEHTEKKLDGKPQTLRNHLINEVNNYHYDREIEYILYGGTGSANVTHAYSSIFAIRFGLNVIFAFSDMETNTFALSIATPISAASWGVLPVPLVQASIQILLALIQSAIDLGNLARGKAVPLFHKKDSWVVTPGGLMNAAKSEASDLLKDAADKAINKAADKLGEYLDKGGEEAEAFIKDNREAIEAHVSQSFDDLIARHANVAVKKMLSLIQNALTEKSKGEPEFNAEQYVSEKLDEWLGTLDEDKSDISYIAKKKTVEMLKEKYIRSSIEKIREIEKREVGSIEALAEEMNTFLSEISEAVKKKLQEGSEEIKRYKEETMKKAKDAMNESAEKLKEELDSSIDGFFGSDGQSGGSGGEGRKSSGESTGISSLLSFRYSDYMRLFLLLGMFTNRTGILLRTADVIQLNVHLVTGDDNYLIRRAGAYYSVEAQVLVKPVLMPLPLFADTFRDPLDDTSWYTIDYKATRGY